MRVFNHTPFAQLVYANEDAQARLFNILIVKATYAFDAEFNLCASPEQEPLNFSDQCHEDVNTSALRYPSDLVPFKPQAEVLLTANAFAPGPALAQWRCGFGLRGAAGQIRAELDVTGPREWRPRWRRSPNADEPASAADPDFLGWDLTEPEPVSTVPLRYELAFGGLQPRGAEILADERNPLGCGWVDRDWTDHRLPQRVPQILQPGVPISDPYHCPAPTGFGPIPPAWLPRRPLGGTYDAAWRAERWPHWAKDYDFAFHNSAPPFLRLPGGFSGDEQILLHHLRPEKPDITFWLPGEAVVARLTATDGTSRQMALRADTLLLDLTAERPEDCLVTLTWRLALLEQDWAELCIETAAVGQDGLEPAPHPAALFPFALEASPHDQ